MNKLYFLFSLLLTHGFLSAQSFSKDSVLKQFQYYETHLATDSVDLSKRKITKTKGLYKVEDRFPDGSLAAILLTNQAPTGRLYPSILSLNEFYPNGKVRTRVERGAGSKDKTEVVHFNNGNVYMESEWKEGKWNIVKMYSPEGEVLAENGNGTAVLLSDFEGERTLETGPLLNGMPAGKWEGYYASGDFFFEENSSESGRVSGTSYDRQGNKYAYQENMKGVTFKGGDKELFHFISRNLEVNPGKMSPGRVDLRFKVDKEGRVSEVESMTKDNPGLVSAATRMVMATNGKWNPGMKRGQLTSMYYTLPVIYRLQ